MTAEENRIWHFEILENKLLKLFFMKMFHFLLLDPREEADEDAVSYFSYTEA